LLSSTLLTLRLGRRGVESQYGQRYG